MHVSVAFSNISYSNANKAIYFNYAAVGKGIKRFLDETQTPRSDLFILSKLYNNSHRKEDVEKALLVSLSDLGLGG